MEPSEVVHLMFCASGVLPATISNTTVTNAGSCGCCVCEKPHIDMQNSFASVESTVGMTLQILTTWNKRPCTLYDLTDTGFFMDPNGT